MNRAQLLTLTAPEMTVLIGGMRVLQTNVDGSSHGVYTDRPGVLSNDFFANMLSRDTEWAPQSGSQDVFDGKDRATGNVKWTGTRIDLLFGSNSQLRSLAEVYGSEDSQEAFVTAFVDVSYLPDSIERDRNQAEFVRPLGSSHLASLRRSSRFR